MFFSYFSVSITYIIIDVVKVLKFFKSTIRSHVHSVRNNWLDQCYYYPVFDYVGNLIWLV